MKKLALTIAIILGLGMTTFADPNGGGLFQRGKDMDATRTWTEGDNPFLPINHGNDYNANGQNGEPTPLGTGIAVLTALGAAYLVGKRRHEE